MSLLSKLLHFVLLTSQKYNIDESHGLSHSMNVLRFASEIYETEVVKHPILKQHEKIIYVSATLHDMCDKKYMDQSEGIREIEEFLKENMLTPTEINVVKMIMSTMSYSTVKKEGFPNLGPYRRAYHIVREADLLSAYDFDRCMIYNMHRKHGDFDEAFKEASHLFDIRVLKHNEDCLFVNEYSRQKSLELEGQSLNQIATWKRLVKNPLLM
uniref:HD domain-containing protein n=1 Tax=viral metagenome TaxID=1070528 RepID=A0A6C0L8X2_9ZZZZ